MAATITLVGARAGKDPEIKFMQDGTAICSFSAALTERKKDGNEWVDGTTTWYRISQFGRDAEATADNIKKGDKVIVTGRLTTSEFVNKDQQKVTVLEIRADGIAPMITAGKKPVQNPVQSSDGSPF
jgi:single-strand DNA-binding protein